MSALELGPAIGSEIRSAFLWPVCDGTRARRGSDSIAARQYSAVDPLLPFT